MLLRVVVVEHAECSCFELLLLRSGVWRPRSRFFSRRADADLVCGLAGPVRLKAGWCCSSLGSIPRLEH